MENAIRDALIKDPVIDITTTGRKSGQPRRIEIWAHYLEGKVYITGSPGKRDWYANMVARPEFTLHLKRGLHRDVPAKAKPITNKVTRRRIFTRLGKAEPRMENLRGGIELWVESSPLVEAAIAA